MRSVRYQFIIGTCLITISACLLFWGLPPPKTIVHVIRLTRADFGFKQEDGITPPTEFNGAASSNDPNNHLSEQVIGIIQMEWPETIRVGDLVEIRLTFLPESQQNNSGDTPNVSSPNNYEQESSHSHSLSARLELAEIAQKPSGVISQPLSLDHPVTFLWRLRAYRSGDYSGNLWLTTAVSDSSINTESTHKVILNRPVSFSASRFLGLNGVESRVLGVICAFVGLFLLLQAYFSKNLSHNPDNSA